MRIISLPMPEGGGEHEVTFWTNHGCPSARMYADVEEEDFTGIDSVLFPVGIAGYGIPAGVPFEVQTIAPCEACGKYLRAMFEWTKKLIVL